MKKTIPFTKAGYDKVVAELELYRTKRPDAIKLLQTAREMGDLSENGAYKAARFEVSFIDRQIRRLTQLIKLGFVQPTVVNNSIQFGTIVVITDGTKQYTYQLVNGIESDPREGRLSTYSPLGKVLMGKKVGDVVEMVAPAGVRKYTIYKISA